MQANSIPTMYNAIREVVAEFGDKARVFGDIGCYTLGALPPFTAIDSCVDMGASITMAKGAADAGVHPSIAIIGDSTFTHSGMTGLLDAVNDHSNIVVVISDNLTTGMTGGQDSAGTSKYEAICVALGVDPAHVRVIVPQPTKVEEIKALIREEIAYPDVSVIIPRRECIQTLARHARQKAAARTDIIYSDLIPMGEADVIISMEPMEALRYLPYLSKDGAVVTSSQSFVNIPNYPESSAIDAELAKLPKVAKLDIEQIAKEVATVRSANVVLLGMAAPYIGILSTDELRSAVARVFQRKGDAIVEANLKAFDAGVAAVG